MKRSLILPAILLVTYLILFVAFRNSLPPSEEIVSTFAGLYQKYGYEIVFIASLAEGLVLVNLFTPGIVTMAMGATFARLGVIDLSWLIVSASAGAVLGYVLDYFLGLYGFSEIIKRMGFSKILAKSSENIKKFGLTGLILGCIYPNIASFLSLVAGTTQISFKLFLGAVILSTAVWMSLWGVAVYVLGEVFLTVLMRYWFIIFLVVIAVLSLATLWEKQERGGA